MEFGESSSDSDTEAEAEVRFAAGGGTGLSRGLAERLEPIMPLSGDTESDPAPLRGDRCHDVEFEPPVAAGAGGCVEDAGAEEMAAEGGAVRTGFSMEVDRPVGGRTNPPRPVTSGDGSRGERCRSNLYLELRRSGWPEEKRREKFAPERGRG